MAKSAPRYALNFRQRTMAALAVALLAHIGVVALLRHQLWPTPPPHVVRAVKIRIIELPAEAHGVIARAIKPGPVKILPQVNPAHVEPKPAGPASQKKPGSALKISPTKSAPKSAIATDLHHKDVSALLPASDWQPTAGAGEPGAGSKGTGRASPQAMGVADRLAGVFDIPLAYRKTGIKQKATAKLVRTPDREAPWMFAAVDGDPLLRAALFEALREPQQRHLVQALFRALGSDEVMIVLSQSTQEREDKAGTYADAYSVEGIKLIIDRIRYVDHSSSPGVMGKALAMLSRPLPDREAQRAKERDSGAVTALERSPAYQAPIRDRDP